MHAVSFKLPDARTVVTTFQWEMTDPVKMGMVEEIFCIRSVHSLAFARFSQASLGDWSEVRACCVPPLAIKHHIHMTTDEMQQRQSWKKQVSGFRLFLVHLVLALTNSLGAGFWSCRRFRIWFFSISVLQVLTGRSSRPFRSVFFFTQEVVQHLTNLWYQSGKFFRACGRLVWSQVTLA